MKCIFILLLVQAITLTSIVVAQRSSSLSNRMPVVDLKKEIMKATHRLPEDRRKLSIFPKNTQKFVITSPPYSKVRKYTPRPMFMTKKTIMPVFIPSITTKEPVTVSSLLRLFKSGRDSPAKVPGSRIHQKIIGEKLVNNRKGFEMNQKKDFEKENQIKDNSEEISTGLPEFADERTEEIENNVLVDFNALSELDNARVQRFAVHAPISVHDSWYFKNVARVPNGNLNEVDDEDEFIFLHNKTKRKAVDSLPSNKSSKSIKEEEIANTSPSISHIFSRSKRSNNVIEEETRITTEPRFSVGREARLNSDVVYNNIHA